jgi:TRAP transporter TAXI family solute receptor
MKTKGRKTFWAGVAVIVFFILAAQPQAFAGAQKEENSGGGLDKPVHLTFSAQGLGTTMNTQANAFSTVFLPMLPPGSSVNVATNSPGGLSSPFAIEEGLADLTIAGAASSYWVSHEPGLLGRPVTKKFRIIAGGLTEQLIIIVMTQDFVKNSGCSTIEEVIAKKYPISFVAKQPGSMGYKAAEAVLGEYKLTFKDIESWGGKVTLTDSSNIVDMMKDSKADVCIDHTSSSQANWTELAMTTPITMDVPAEKVLAGLRAQGFSNTVFPKGSYNNVVKADLHTVGSNDTLACSSDLNDDLVYLLTKITCENKDKLVSIFSTFKVFDPQTAWEPSKCGAPLHPGAERYYREKGWMK